MQRLPRIPVDTFVLALLVVVATAAVFPAPVGLIMLPLRLFHQILLIVCAAIASRMSRTPPGA